MSFEPGARAFAGAQFLDVMMPGWAAKIDLESFNIEYDRTCALAQVYDCEFEDAAVGLDLDEREVISLGFFVKQSLPNVREAHYRRLTDAWRTEITGRLEADAEDQPMPLAA